MLLAPFRCFVTILIFLSFLTEATAQEKVVAISKAEEMELLQGRIMRISNERKSLERALGAGHRLVSEIQHEESLLNGLFATLSANLGSPLDLRVRGMMKIAPKRSNADVEIPDYPSLVTVHMLPPETGYRGFVFMYCGRTIRRFVDTNNDNKIDNWIYFQHGRESYRDIDSDNDGKVDSWLYIEGNRVRFMADKDDDGFMDVSHEEDASDFVTRALLERGKR